MTREPDRYEAILADWERRFNSPASRRSMFDRADLLAYLRQAADEALERAAYIAESYGCDYAAKNIRALKSLAAAPAPEPERFFPGAAELMGNPPAEPVASSLLRRVLAALESYADLTQSTTLDREIRALAAELRRYIAGMETGHDFGALLRVQLELVEVQRKRIAELEAAIRWACGEGDEFPTRQPGQGAYWWRTELRRRAALADGGEGK